MDKLFRVLVHEDVDPSIDQGSLQGGATHPLPFEVRQTPLLVWQQQALITLLVQKAQREIKGPTLCKKSHSHICF